LSNTSDSASAPQGDRSQALAAATNDFIWAKISELHTADARLDANTQALMRSKNPNVYGVSRNAIN